MPWLFPAAVALAMSAQEAVEAALARAPALEVSEARIAEAEARVASARARLLPTVQASAGLYAQTEIAVDLLERLPDLPEGIIDTSDVEPLLVQPGFQAQAGAQALVPLVAPAGWAAVRAAREGERWLEAEREADRSRVVKATIEAWHASALSHALEADAKRAVDLADRLVARGQTLVDLGAVGSDGLLPFRRAQAEARARLAEAQSARETADGVLQALTGLEGHGELPASTPGAFDVFSAIQGLDRPDLAAAEARTGAAAARQRAQDRARWPVLAAVGGVQLLDPEPDIGEALTWRVGLQLSVPLYQGGLTQAAVAEARAQRQQAEAGARALREQAEIEVRMAHGALSRAQAGLLAQEEAVSLAAAAVENAEKRLSEGGGSLLELERAQAELVAAEAARTRARAEAARAADGLRLAMRGGV